MKPWLDTGDVQVFQGDCREVMRSLPDASVDSVVTDPPYELSNDGKHSPARVAAEVMFPQESHFPSSIFEDCGFDGLALEIARLSGVGVVPSPTAPVEVSSMALNDEPAAGNDQIANANKLTVSAAERNGTQHRDTDGDKYLGCFGFKLADREAAIDALYRSGTGFVAGGFRVGLCISPASHPSLFHGSASVVLSGDDIRTFDKTLSSLVGASTGTTDGVVPNPFDLRWGLENHLSAVSALELLSLGRFAGAQFVRASSATGGLATVLEPVRFRVVGDPTNGAITFDLLCHKPRIASMGFMGKSWDGSKIAYDLDVWREALRVLKPGGHLLAFGGTRTWHRLAVAIEDAGFEVRDSIAWMYGSGFPKSLDVSKAIDKARKDETEWRAVGQWLKSKRVRAGFTRQSIAPLLSAHKNLESAAANISNWENGLSFPTWGRWIELKTLIGFGDDMDAEVWRLNGRKGQPGEAWAEREVVGKGFRVDKKTSAVPISGATPHGHYDITAPATPAAQQWQGWGTALKPAFEPIVVARKPLIGTVAENVLAHGTGALNIDGCRVGTEERINPPGSANPRIAMNDGWRNDAQPTIAIGRWPANVILDESQAAELDRQADELPSRFFYVPKANSSERPRAGEVAHPTVKPLTLLTYLVRLVTPPGGTVLEPFAGSGTTLEACVIEGFNAIGIEMTEDYLPLIEQRLTKPIQQVLA